MITQLAEIDRSKSLGDVKQEMKNILYIANAHEGSYEFSATLSYLYVDYEKYSLLAAMAELRRLSPDDNAKRIDDAIGQYAGMYTRSYANTKEAAQDILRNCLPEWKDTRFFYMDCPISKPFC